MQCKKLNMQTEGKNKMRVFTSKQDALLRDLRQQTKCYTFSPNDYFLVIGMLCYERHLLVEMLIDDNTKKPEEVYQALCKLKQRSLSTSHALSPYFDASVKAKADMTAVIYLYRECLKNYV